MSFDDVRWECAACGLKGTAFAIVPGDEAVTKIVVTAHKSINPDCAGEPRIIRPTPN